MSQLSFYICVRVCLGVHRHKCVCIYLHMHTHTHTYLCVYINAHTHTHTRIYICYYCQREYSFIFYIAEELFIKNILHLTHYFPKILEHKHCIFFNEDSKDLRLPCKASFNRLFYYDRLKSCRYKRHTRPLGRVMIQWHNFVGKILELPMNIG